MAAQPPVVLSQASQEVIYHRIGLPAVQDVLTGEEGGGKASKI